MLSKEERELRQRLSHARSKVKQFEAKILKAEQRAAFWRRRVADLQFEKNAVIQPPLWPGLMESPEILQAEESLSSRSVAALEPSSSEQ